MVVHLPGEFSRGKGQRSNGEGRKERGADKSFCGPRKKFWRSAFHPLDDDPTVLRPALRVRTHGGWPHRANRMHTPDTSERRGGLKATVTPSRSGRRDRHGRSKPGVDLRHQTLAKPEPRRDSAETGGCAAAALAEWGSTTGQLRWPGAEGGHRPARFSVSGHERAVPSLPHSDLRRGEGGLKTLIINANVRIH